MYNVKGVHWIWRDGVRQEPKPDKRFHTAMEMLHWALKTGMIQRASIWNDTVPRQAEMERVSIPYSGSGEWRGDWYFSPEQVEAMGRALSRYRAILRYFREVEPEWTEVPESRVSYADNSVEATEQDKYGRTRRVTLESPHGDRCF